ncbi:hypothetical protein DB35_23745 [Streptomyces abyssalis]|uniref:Uncharacterized protein n=1 Tax=Streptomyces abyssalis TaxID=933944 RepID=A0A1E7JNS2_9ACTN|nr:hypothetical protein DB35_23745 [Streptomyces abyssalis]OEU89931.1 hypothetical protein AN215_09790 [Streptomyces abyssalis]
MGFSEDDVRSWAGGVSRLHEGTVHSQDGIAAGQAAAMLMSGGGFVHEPVEVLTMLTQAIEVGYAAALADLRNGRLEDRIAEIHPSCTTNSAPRRPHTSMQQMRTRSGGISRTMRATAT